MATLIIAEVNQIKCTGVLFIIVKICVKPAKRLVVLITKNGAELCQKFSEQF